MNKIKIIICILKVWFQLLFELLKDTSFLHYPEGGSKKFKLFGNQYMAQSRLEKRGKRPTTKTVAYITALSSSFSPSLSDEEKLNSFNDLLKYTFLWYCFYKFMEFDGIMDENDNKI